MEMNWIPVTERLPEYTYQANGEGFALVLTASGDGGVHETMFCNGIFYEPLLQSFDEAWIVDAHKRFSKTVTHWMPLPTPPGR